MHAATSEIDIMQTLPARTAADWKVVPIEATDDRVRIAAVLPERPELLDNLRVLFGSEIELTEIDEPDFQRMYSERYGMGAAEVEKLGAGSSIENEGLKLDQNESSMARFVDGLIRQAHLDGATDIHIEPYECDLGLRFRVDGLLRPVPTPPSLASHRAALVSRIKVMAGMNIAEKRLPQDGRIRLKDQGGDIDIRVATIPTIHGESVDLRLLPKNRLVLGLEQLGMTTEIEQRVAALIERPNGILLVTGPTGHGKSTTLYACLSRLNTPDRKIIAIEDPVEYRLKGISQVQIHQKIGLSFATALRSVLRQDPDVLMVGEIRDVETAEIAIRASLTGHLVFSTLHTNDAVDALTRLMDMGIEPYLVASSVNGVLSQRLVRTVCDACAGTTSAACATCRGTGLRGRTGLFELFEIDDESRTMIMGRASARDIRRRAKEKGMRTLAAEGRRKADRGVTTWAEVRRVAGEEA